jgi:hypothetical protein
LTNLVDKITVLTIQFRISKPLLFLVKQNARL